MEDILDFIFYYEWQWNEIDALDELIEEKPILEKEIELAKLSAPTKYIIARFWFTLCCLLYAVIAIGFSFFADEGGFSDFFFSEFHLVLLGALFLAWVVGALFILVLKYLKIFFIIGG